MEDIKMQKKNKNRLLIAAACIGAALLIGCPQDEPVDPGIELPEENVVLANHADTVKLNTKGQRVLQILWQEPWPDPRVQIGYQLDDENGTPFFDHYVMLYGFRLSDRDCASNPEATYCNETGLHIHIDTYANTGKYINDYEKYFKALHDRGMKILFSIVPHGNGVAAGTLYRWPNETRYPWRSMYNEAYPYNEAAVARIIEQIKTIYQKCPFDGIAYDEEYANNGSGDNGRGNVYPSTTEENRIYGENLLRFSWEVEQAILPLHKDADGNPKEWFTEVYEHGSTAGSIPASFSFVPTGGTERITIYRDGVAENDPQGRSPAPPVIDYSYESMYGGWSSSSPNGIPKYRYGPASCAVSDISGGPRPPVGYSGPGILQRMEAHQRGNYGVVMYYGLMGRKGIRNKFPNHFGANNPYPETYFTQVSETLYGYKTVFIGKDYDEE
jgi:hypothetical protein